MHAVGDQAQRHIPLQRRRRDRTRGAVVQAWHRIERVGDHPHPGLEGRAGLMFIGLAVAKAHQDAELSQGFDHLGGTGQLRRQGHQGDLLFETGDAGVERLQAWRRQMVPRVGAAAGLGQEWPF